MFRKFGIFPYLSLLGDAFLIIHSHLFNNIFSLPPGGGAGNRAGINPTTNTSHSRPPTPLHCLTAVVGVRDDRGGAGKTEGGQLMHSSRHNTPGDDRRHNTPEYWLPYQSLLAKATQHLPNTIYRCGQSRKVASELAT